MSTSALADCETPGSCVEPVLSDYRTQVCVDYYYGGPTNIDMVCACFFQGTYRQTPLGRQCTDKKLLTEEGFSAAAKCYTKFVFAQYFHSADEPVLEPFDYGYTAAHIVCISQVESTISPAFDSKVFWLQSWGTTQDSDGNISASRKLDRSLLYRSKYWECEEGAELVRASTPSGFRCKASPVISLTGASTTKTMITGPALTQTARVSQGGIGAAGKTVTVTSDSGLVLVGTTNSEGLFVFTYVPPYTAMTDRLTATCAGCKTPATHEITVEEADVCEGQNGNPVSAVTGEKTQTEVDWQDKTPHPLSITRFYRSYSKFAFELGAHWSHEWMTWADRAERKTIIHFGDGSRVSFERATPPSPWVADNRSDALEEVANGFIYTRGDDLERSLFDDAGRLMSVTQRNGWAMTLLYNENAQLISVRNAFGRALTFAYDADGRLRVVTTPDGRTIEYSFDGLNRLSDVLYPDGAGRIFVYEDVAHPGALTGIIDERGVRYASFTYDLAGRATSTEHAGHTQAYSFVYDEKLTSEGPKLIEGSQVGSSAFTATTLVTDPLNTLRSSTWRGGDGDVQLLESNGAFSGQSVASRTFTPGTTLVSTQNDFLGTQASFQWDTGRKLLTSSTLASNTSVAQLSQTQWHPDFKLPSKLTEPGRVTVYGYDDAGTMLSQAITDTATGQTRTSRWSYNQSGLIDVVTDPKGATSQLSYDSAGNLSSLRNALGEQTEFQYDSAGNMVARVEPTGVTTTFTYDERNRVRQITKGGEQVAFAYTPIGTIESVTLPNGNVVHYEYDDAQRLSRVSDSRGGKVTYTRDGMGNPLREEATGATGGSPLSVTRGINALNRVVSSSDSNGKTSTYAYDLNGELISATNSLGQMTQETLDPLGRPIATTFTDRGQATYTWSPSNEVTSATDPRGIKTQYTRNGFGEVIAQNSPDTGGTTFTRDANGNVFSRRDAKGLVTSTLFDALNRPTAITHADGTRDTLVYDPAGDVSRFEDSSGHTTFTRDELGRILTKTQVVREGVRVLSTLGVSYAYHPGGGLAQITYPSGLVVTYAQNTSGQTTQVDVRLPGRGQTAPFVRELAYNALNQVKSWRWFNGEVAQRTFDPEGRVTSTELSTYTYDAEGRIIGLTQNLRAQRGVVPISWQVAYDARGRISRFERFGDTVTYSYDSNGNRLTSSENSTNELDLDGVFDDSAVLINKTTTGENSIDPSSNRLLGTRETSRLTPSWWGHLASADRRRFVFDANGNLLTDGSRSFDYDTSNRLVRASAHLVRSSGAVKYRHNARGQRVFKSLAGWWSTVGQSLLYSDSGPVPNLLGEYGPSAERSFDRVEFIWLPGEDGQAMPIGLFAGGRLWAIHADNLNTPRLVTDDGARTVWQWPYSAFGTTKPTGVLSSSRIFGNGGSVRLRATAPALIVNLRYPGQVFDAESGLFHNWRRVYDPRLGRYLQNDPGGIEGGFNTYAYVDANPLTFTDPEALEKLKPVRPAPTGGGEPSSGELGGAGKPFKPSDVFTPFPMGVPGRPAMSKPVVVPPRPVYSPVFGPRGINPSGSTTNCAKCCVATDSTINGFPIAAPAAPRVQGVTGLERLFGRTFGPRGSIESVSQQLLNGGPGTRAIIAAESGPGWEGHLFNGVNEGGTIKFWDGQTGGAAQITGKGYETFRGLITSD